MLFENLLLQGVEFDPELHTQGDPATQVQGIVLLKSIQCMRTPASVVWAGSLNWIEASSNRVSYNSHRMFLVSKCQLVVQQPTTWNILKRWLWKQIACGLLVEAYGTHSFPRKDQETLAKRDPGQEDLPLLLM